MKKRLTLIILFAVILSATACGANRISPSELTSVGEVAYTETESRILQKLAELGKYKASHNTACDEATALRDELDSLGAFPSEETLAEIKLDAPIRSNAGETISDLSDFSRVFDGVYDIFGIEKTYESDGKTYAVFEAIIQAKIGDPLMMKLVQGGRLGADFFSESKAESVRYSESNGKSADIKSSTARGKTRSYAVVAFSLPTVSLLFVKGDGGEWRHTMTSSFANIYEDHFCVYSDSKDDYTTVNETYDSVEYPEGYARRHAYAVEAYKLGDTLCLDTVSEVEIAPKVAELDEIADKRFALEVASPSDVAELVKMADK